MSWIVRFIYLRHGNPRTVVFSSFVNISYYILVSSLPQIPLPSLPPAGAAADRTNAPVHLWRLNAADLLRRWPFHRLLLETPTSVWLELSWRKTSLPRGGSALISANLPAFLSP